MDTPERAELDGAYAECVQTEGYDASLPQDMQMMVWGLGVDVPPEERTRLELRIASADVACRLKTRIPFEVAVGRALMANPKLLLMDEPSMGLAPILVAQSFEIIQQVNQAGVAMLVVEQNANVSLSIADRGYVLSTGRVVLEGKAADLLENQDLRKAYLGR